MQIPIDIYTKFSKEILITNQSLQELSSSQNWDDKFRLLMISGKKFPTNLSLLKIDDFLIRGCESKAWLTSTISNNSVLFLASSESKIIRGLLTPLISEINSKPIEYIQNFNAEKLFENLGLERHLSESRKGGLHTLWKEIQVQVSKLSLLKD